MLSVYEVCIFTVMKHMLHSTRSVPLKYYMILPLHLLYGYSYIMPNISNNSRIWKCSYCPGHCLYLLQWLQHLLLTLQPAKIYILSTNPLSLLSPSSLTIFFAKAKRCHLDQGYGANIILDLTFCSIILEMI